jgi:hypothetical protein
MGKLIVWFPRLVKGGNVVKEITNSQDIIDSRDVIARIAELEDRVFNPIMVADEYEKSELGALLELQEEAEGYSDWKDGATLIRDSYFEQYAEEFAEDIGAIDPDTSTWPSNHIDWEAAANELKGEYTGVTFDGVEYWVR